MCALCVYYRRSVMADTFFGVLGMLSPCVWLTALDTRYCLVVPLGLSFPIEYKITKIETYKERYSSI